MEKEEKDRKKKSHHDETWKNRSSSCYRISNLCYKCIISQLLDSSNVKIGKFLPVFPTSYMYREMLNSFQSEKGVQESGQGKGECPKVPQIGFTFTI